MSDLEKYQLVGIISGCTIFVVSFWLLIDFCKYHKNKRLKREKSYIMHSRLQPEKRMAVPFSSDAMVVTPRSETRTQQIVLQRRDSSFRKILKFFNIVKESADTCNDGRQEQTRDARSRSVATDRLIKGNILKESHRRFSERQLSTDLDISNDDSKPATKEDAFEHPRSARTYMANLEHDRDQKTENKCQSDLDVLLETESTVYEKDSSSTDVTSSQGEHEMHDMSSTQKDKMEEKNKKLVQFSRQSLESDQTIHVSEDIKFDTNGEYDTC